MAPTEEQIQVIVRCRPMNEDEAKQNCKPILSMTGEACVISKQDGQRPGTQDKKTFTFDKAYPESATTEEIYQDVVSPVIQSVTEGYNGTIFAYGQTSCGKTYTMQGVPEPETQHGIIPRAIQDIFKGMESCKEQFIVHASCYEIYNEDIRDLLGKSKTKKLEVGSFPNKGFYVKELSKHPVTDVQQCERLITKAMEKRSTAATQMNSKSSRSHTIFSICVEAQIKDGHIRAGKLNLVDLAGSEKLSKSGVTGDRQKESIKINLSLHCLGKVISTLAEGKKQHIPYRDSKLTKLLQDSLGGTARTVMVACVSPADYNYEETISTLQFAGRAKKIVNKPVINEDPKDALIRELRAQLEEAGKKQHKMPETDIQPLIAQMVQEREDEYEKEKEAMQAEYERKLTEIEKQLEEVKKQKTLMEEDMSRMAESQHVDQTERIATDPELHVLLIGSRKCSTGDSLTGSSLFGSKTNFVPISKVSKCGSVYHDNRGMLVVDNMGLLDILETDHDKKNEMMKCSALTSPGLHAVLFVTQIERFTEDDQKLLEFYKQYFGPGVVDYMIIVFTRQDSVEHDDMTLKEHLQGASPILQGLVRECQDRYIAVNHKASDEAKDQFTRDLIAIIDKTMTGSCFTNDIFDVTESVIRSKEREILAEAEEETSLKLDEIEKVQNELLQKQREESERKAEENRQRQEEEMKKVIKEKDEMVQKLRLEEERKTQLMKAEQERKIKELEKQSEEQIQKERELKARLETQIDEKRHVYEREIRAAQEKAEELRVLRERDLEAARLDNEERLEDERRRVALIQQEKEQEMQRLEEKAKEENEKQREEDELLARAVQRIAQQDYDYYVQNVHRKARFQAMTEAVTDNLDSPEWTCNRCTFINKADRWKCEVCDASLSDPYLDSTPGSTEDRDDKGPSEDGSQSEHGFRGPFGQGQQYGRFSPLHGSRHSDHSKHPGDIHDRRIVLIGESGSGKSATGNNILGKQVFESSVCRSSGMQKCQKGTGTRFDWNIEITECPGLWGTGMIHGDFRLELAKCYGMTAPGPHAFVLVVRIDRFTRAEQIPVEYLKEMFGEDMLKHLIILFTKKDDITYEGLCLQQYLETVPAHAEPLLKCCNNRYVAFNNRGTPEERDADVKELLKLVDNVFYDNGEQFYTSKMFAKAKKVVKAREEQLMCEHLQKVQEETEATKSNYEEQLKKIQRSQLELTRPFQARIKVLERDMRRKQRDAEAEENGTFEEVINLATEIEAMKLTMKQMETESESKRTQLRKDMEKHEKELRQKEKQTFSDQAQQEIQNWQKGGPEVQAILGSEAKGFYSQVSSMLKQFYQS